MMRAIALTGPTASGKTVLSLGLAESLGCEIICCDSMQIYRGMDIGTAKATKEERERVPHHMLDVISPLSSYSAQNYREDALAVAKDITKRGKIPLFVGGTGLYIDTVVRGGAVESPPSNQELKERLLSEIRTEEDIDRLHAHLMEIDPESAERIHKNNVRRVARAIEIYELTGKTKSYFDKLSRTASPDIRVGMITLDFHNRDNLYARVDMRVDIMLNMGLLDEVKGLYEIGLLSPTSTAYQAIGYKELVSVITGECSLDEARELIKLSTRRYAKRQLTWFRHETESYRVYVDTDDGIMKGEGTLLEEVTRAAMEWLGNEKTPKN